MKRKDFLIGGIPLLAALTIIADKLWPRHNSHTGSITVGTIEEAEPYWPVFIQAAAELGVHVKTINFSGYQLVNPALVEKHIDINLFQHLRFLAQYIANSGHKLYPYGATEIVPLCLYSHKYSSPAQIPEGSTIVIPNDTTNQGRALNLLSSAGLLTLIGDPFNPTPADIAPGSRIKLITVDAAQTARNIASTAGVVVNNNFATKAKLDPQKAIYKDDPHNPRAAEYINIFVCRPEDAYRKEFALLLKARHDPRVIATIAKTSNNASVEVQVPQKDLQKILDELVNKLRKP